MSEIKVKLPTGLKILSYISGILAIGLAIIAFVNISLVFIETTLILGIAILIIGIMRIVIGTFEKRQTKWFRIFNVVIGVLIIPIGIIEIAGVMVSEIILIDILALSILLLGIISIVKGFENKKKVPSYRLVIILLGAILVTLSAAVLITDSILTTEPLNYMLATAILLLGLKRLLDGILDYRIFKQPKIEAT
jgi:uncharacterized membrane protein HdeD (DUF308 family)